MPADVSARFIAIDGRPHFAAWVHNPCSDAHKRSRAAGTADFGSLGFASTLNTGFVLHADIAKEGPAVGAGTMGGTMPGGDRSNP